MTRNARTRNHARLVNVFVEAVRELAPTSVLDVGCGTGSVLFALASSPAPFADLAVGGEADLAVGVEPDASRVREARSRGGRVFRAAAGALPFRDASFDVVVLRHILHHVPQPERALEEALRVARVGIVAAEPWRNASGAGQSDALALDRWMKTRDRECGMWHTDDIPAETIASFAQAGRGWRTRILRAEAEESAPLAEFDEDLEARLEGASEEQRAELGELRESFGPAGVALTGTAIVVAVP